ncbi:MAG: hypothetical protein NZM06_10870 [Chloroherpetonaceae bacterium]|nr:hypothetical protein [Chloroherpetonaceae bacterium]MDW8438207.1 hypothetical protein [Chloroherpetonaceae bacterium]
MTYAEQKWKASEEKVRFAKAFPPLLKRKDESLTVLDTIPLQFGALIVYADHRFTFEPLDENDVPKFLSNLRESRRYLYEHHREHYDKLDELTARDKELTRLARFEKLLSAIVNNALEFPELREAIPKCLANPSAPVESHLPPNPNIKAIRLLNALRDNLPDMPELLQEAPKALNGESALVPCDMLKRLATREA